LKVPVAALAFGLLRFIILHPFIIFDFTKIAQLAYIIQQLLFRDLATNRLPIPYIYRFS
jgi:hypothetical protein